MRDQLTRKQSELVEILKMKGLHITFRKTSGRWSSPISYRLAWCGESGCRKESLKKLSWKTVESLIEKRIVVSSSLFETATHPFLILSSDFDRVDLDVWKVLSLKQEIY